MKITAILIGLLVIATPVLAGAITDSVKPLGHMKTAVAVEDNFIFDREIEKLTSRDKFDLEDVNQIYGKASLGLTPYFNVYAKLGASDSGEIKTNNLATGNDLIIESNYGFLWGVGLSGAKEFWEGFKLGADAQFNYWKSDADTIENTAGAKATTVSGEIENFEAQGTPFITKKFEFPDSNLEFNPYLGVKFSYFLTETDGNIAYNLGGSKTESWSLNSDNNVGIVVGSDAKFAEKWTVHVEGRFIDETAITAGGTYRF